VLKRILQGKDRVRMIKGQVQSGCAASLVFETRPAGANRRTPMPPVASLTRTVRIAVVGDTLLLIILRSLRTAVFSTA
jgi:hypothetical protein